MAQLSRAGAADKAARLQKRFGRRPLIAAAIAILVIVAVIVGAMQANGRAVSIERDVRSDTGSTARGSRGRDESGSGKRDRNGRAAGSKDSDDQQTETQQLVVDVSGAVMAPAVVQLVSGARVADAIAAAGGLSSDADVSALNRAAKVSDGDKIYVPRQGEQGAPAAPAGQKAGSNSGGRAASGASSLVNINTATAEELDALPGVGPSTAQAIIDDRTQNGPFSGIEDLMRVSGIGEKKFEKLKSKICA
ncbi:competence protein ComEA helix-hairpin-helix repeat protein [Coriobacterium glomerans PW2]|uniref:Competence protein ComEA helix-hairpin-helix repeat protein n=1 Tax=Coriobacterium glomerans (strain ATCC 49209 / DSM 20642 / JCM 10262 / PW2) TaxID=700015 RepID=F2N7P3_CORGP|nr:helix-hairpin-helix domain-containing protein [Coriobacterium glomerans]AEB06935.1 competence protein ComEA helix-hairpin-helix repeat protein [Coriobacterium glomerans PW2]